MVERYVLSDTVAEDKSSIEGQYSKLEINRETYLERARESSELTIPTLFPPKSFNEATEYKTPFQSIGARGVMNLASKMMLALFPPQAPFFRLSLDDLVYKQIQADPKQKTVLEQGLAKIEKAVMDNLEVSNDRVAIYEALKQLIVSGNVVRESKREISPALYVERATPILFVVRTRKGCSHQVFYSILGQNMIGGTLNLCKTLWKPAFSSRPKGDLKITL